jgi:hypothetical protein
VFAFRLPPKPAVVGGSAISTPFSEHGRLKPFS